MVNWFVTDVFGEVFPRRNAVVEQLEAETQALTRRETERVRFRLLLFENFT